MDERDYAERQREREMLAEATGAANGLSEDNDDLCNEVSALRAENTELRGNIEACPHRRRARRAEDRTRKRDAEIKRLRGELERIQFIAEFSTEHGSESDWMRDIEDFTKAALKGAKDDN